MPMSEPENKNGATPENGSFVNLPSSTSTPIENNQGSVQDEDGTINPPNEFVTSQVRLCGVCNEGISKYKCSRCEIPYCSVACATLHRATHPAVTEAVPLPPVEPDILPFSNGHVKVTPGTLTALGSQNAFTVLEGSQKLQTLFMMYPRLRSQLRDIYAATLPPKDDSPDANGNHVGHHSFQRGRGRGGAQRGIGRTDRPNAPWNPDQGTQNGIDALTSAKVDYGKAGEGVREYAELVISLVSRDGLDVAQLVQEEVAEENAKIIAQLLNGEDY